MFQLTEIICKEIMNSLYLRKLMDLILRIKFFLEKENIILFLREHAESKIKSNFKSRNLESNIFNFSLEIFRFRTISNLFDVIITYSGIFLEHLITDKSLAFALFDFEEYERNRGLILPKDVLFPGYTFQSQKNLFII